MMGGVKRENRKKTIDSIAASYILEGYLQRMKSRAFKEARQKEQDGEEPNEI
jgi:hypothetical protein